MITVKHGDRVLARNVFFKLANDNFPGRLDDQVNDELIIESDTPGVIPDRGRDIVPEAEPTRHRRYPLRANRGIPPNRLIETMFVNSSLNVGKDVVTSQGFRRSGCYLPGCEYSKCLDLGYKRIRLRSLGSFVI